MCPIPLHRTPPCPAPPRTQVTRTQLEEWVNQPFFERDALNGCVVRMAYGPGVRDNTGATHPGYMVMQVRSAAHWARWVVAAFHVPPSAERFHFRAG